MRVLLLWMLAAMLGGSCSDSSVHVACNDGTGKDDCCRAGIAGGRPCGASYDVCYGKCMNGIRQVLTCGSGYWMEPQDTMRCGVDAGGN